MKKKKLPKFKLGTLFNNTIVDPFVGMYTSYNKNQVYPTNLNLPNMVDLDFLNQLQGGLSSDIYHTGVNKVDYPQWQGALPVKEVDTSSFINTGEVDLNNSQKFPTMVDLGFLNQLKGGVSSDIYHTGDNEVDYTQWHGALPAKKIDTSSFIKTGEVSLNNSQNVPTKAGLDFLNQLQGGLSSDIYHTGVNKVDYPQWQGALPAKKIDTSSFIKTGEVDLNRTPTLSANPTKEEKEVFNKSNLWDFMGNPALMADVDLNTALFKLGQSVNFDSDIIDNPEARQQAKSGNLSRLIGSSVKSALGLGRTFLSGYGYQNRMNGFYDDYTKNLRKSIAGEGKYNFVGKDGGIVPKFDMGGILEALNGTEAQGEEFIEGLPPQMSNLANAEIESGEYVQHPKGEVQKVKGKKHAQGGEKVLLEPNTKIISDNLKVGKDLSKKLTDLFGIKVKAGDTYAKLIDKYSKEIGYKDLTEKEEKLIKKLEKYEAPEDLSTSKLNAEFLKKEVLNLSLQKEQLEEKRKQFTDFIFNIQELSKIDKAVKEELPKMEYGGVLNNPYLHLLNSQFKDESSLAYLKKGGEIDEEKEGDNKGKEEEEGFGWSWEKKNEDTNTKDVDPTLLAYLKTLEPEFQRLLVLTETKDENVHTKNSRHGKDRAIDLRVDSKLYERLLNDPIRLAMGVTLLDKKHGNAPHIHLSTGYGSENTHDAWVDPYSNKAKKIIKEKKLDSIYDNFVDKSTTVNTPVDYNRDFTDLKPYFKTYSLNQTTNTTGTVNDDIKTNSVAQNTPTATDTLVNPTPAVTENSSLATPIIPTPASTVTPVKPDPTPVVIENSSLVTPTIDTPASTVTPINPDPTPVVFENSSLITQRTPIGIEDPSTASAGSVTDTGVSSGTSDSSAVDNPNQQGIGQQQEVSISPTDNIEDFDYQKLKKQFQLFYLPDQSTTPPDALGSHLKVDRRYDRLDPFEMSNEANRVEIGRSLDFLGNQLQGMPDNITQATLSNALATTQDSINKSEAQVSLANAQERARVNQINLGIQGQEENARAADLLNYEQRELTALGKTLADYNNYFDYNKKVRINNYNQMVKMNVLNQLFDNFNIDPFGSIELDPNNQTKFSANGLSKTKNTDVKGKKKSKKEDEDSYLKAMQQAKLVQMLLQGNKTGQ